MLAKVLACDPYYLTQDNGAGAPLHFATTYGQLDMVHHLINLGAEVNQRDTKSGMTPLHRAAYLSHVNGYLEIYEYLLTRGADPTVKADDFDPYLDPGRKTPVELARKEMRERLLELEERHKDVPRVRVPHPDIGDWWTLYDYGPDHVRSWAPDHAPAYPEAVFEGGRRARDAARRAEKKAARLRAIAEAEAGAGASPAASPADPAAGGASPVAFLFPGQGSQAVGMLRATRDLPAVREMLATAERVLGYDLLAVTEGDRADLDDTARAQPALLVGGLAAVDACSACAGLSLGEYTALVFAGALSLEDALRVVKVRAESMAAAAAAGDPHGMLSVIGLGDEALEALCGRVRGELGDGTVCQVANRLFPQGRVVSGHRRALDQAQTYAAEAGALKAAPLAVSGAFHTPLMAPARDALAAVLETVAIREPRVPVWSNVTARPVEGGADALRALLARQLVEPVEWEATLTALVRDEGKSRLFELGPGAQIKAMCKRIDLDAWKAFRNVGS